jgi:hypothetical protein
MDPNIRPEMQLKASAAIASRRKALISDALEVDKTLQDLRQQQLQELLSTVGNDRYADYAELRRRTRERVRSLGAETTLGRGRPTDRMKSHRAILDEARQALKSMGIDGDIVKKIKRESAKKALSVVDAKSFAAGQGDRADLAVPRLNEQLCTPPYNYDVVYTSDNGDPSAVRAHAATADRLTGNITTSTDVSIWDSGDADIGESRAAGSVYCWFKVPFDGKLLVRLSLLATNTLFYGRCSDEWGVSSLSGVMRLRCHVWVVNPVYDNMGGIGGYPYWPGQEQYLAYVGDGEDEFSWNMRPFPAGYEQDWFFTSVQPWTAGTDVLLECGVWQYNHFFVNDFSCFSTILSNWQVKSIGLSVVPPGM